METLLTESMICSFSSSGLLQGSSLRELSSGSFSMKLRGNFRQNGTQLELTEYHARFLRRLLEDLGDLGREGLCGDSRPRLSAGRSPAAFFGFSNGSCIANRSSGIVKSRPCLGNRAASSVPSPPRLSSTGRTFAEVLSSC